MSRRERTGGERKRKLRGRWGGGGAKEGKEKGDERVSEMSQERGRGRRREAKRDEGIKV